MVIQMTIKQAIKILTEAGFGINIWNTPVGYCEENWHEALEMAIDKLSEKQDRYKVYFTDKDHVWINGKQYVSLRRFLEVKTKAQEESEASDAEAPSEDEDLGEWQPVLDYDPKYVDGNWEIRSEQSYYGGLPERLPMFKCSKCGTSYMVIGKGREQRELIYVTSRKTPHCPFCGKKMKGGQDE